MSNLIPFQPGQISSVFGNVPDQDDLSSGISGGFGHIGYKGKVWSIRYRGAEMILMRDDGDGPRNSIEVVIVKSAAVVAKIWYENRFVEGSTDAPDCFSTNGVTPEVSSKKRQSTACAICPRNVWGSRVTDQGKQAKECQDNKRLAVVPLGDILNEPFGGPLLLRVPAASLADLATYGQTMRRLGYPYFAIGTRIAFDPNAAYPKFTFQAIRPLNDDEARLVIEHQRGGMIDRILAEMEGAAPSSVETMRLQELATHFEQPPQEAQQSRTQPSAPTPQAAPAAPAQQPSTAEQSRSGFGPTTGSAQSAPAQPAASTTPTQSTSGPGPATAPARTRTRSAGSATAASSQGPRPTTPNTASTANGFGRTAPATVPGAGTAQNSTTSGGNEAGTDQARWDAALAATQTPKGDNPEGNGSEFETALDAKLDAILPPTR